MIKTLDGLFVRTRELSHHAAIVSLRSRTTWGELAEQASVATAALSLLRGQRVGILHRGDALSWAALTALDRLATDTFLLDATLPTDDVRRFAEDFRFAAVVNPGTAKEEMSWHVEPFPPSAGSGESSVTILTSGTTGKPKAVRHTWASLCRPVRVKREAESLPWLLTYRPHLYAGLQVCMQCFASGGTLVVPDAGATVDRIVGLMAREQVACASATPSYWRQLLILSSADKLTKINLRQITLGGEVVDQHVLDMLKGAFPNARITHIYATTELGRCFSVVDGMAGFPARFLDAVSTDGVELRIHEDELQVRSANAMHGYDAQSGAINAVHSSDNWFPTGDLVRREGDRVLFVGRETDIINVGGNKVSPQEVERVLRSVAGVADVRVYAKKSSMVGQLVAAEIVPIYGENAEAVRAAVVDAGVHHLTPQQRPRIIEIVDRIKLSSAGKMNRN